MGLYKEQEWSRKKGIILLVLSLLVIYMPWLCSERELFRQESIYAVGAVEFSHPFFWVTAHGVPVYNAAPLFPGITALLSRLFQLPVEFVMRGISVFMLGAGAVLAYFAAASQRTPKAGFVAAAFYASSFIAMEKGVEGNPATMSACFLLAAQLLFFYYGMRKSNWNKAWLLSAFFLVLSFLSGGFLMLACFIVPMFFFRRPLSVSSKFRSPGFVLAVVILAAVVILWSVPYVMYFGDSLYDIWLDSVLFYKRRYLADIVEFPLFFFLRLLPWSLIAWLPFCVALQDLDKTPIFSRYLRTLVFVSAVVIWFFSAGESRGLLYLTGPLAVLTGITYELGTRRYGQRIRKVLICGEGVLAGLALLILLVKFLPEKSIRLFASLSNSMAFRNEPGFLIQACCGCALLLACSLLFHFWRKSRPLWFMLLLISAGCGIFYGTVVESYRAQVTGKRQIGRVLRKALETEKAERVYKMGINDLYGELFYAGIKAQKLRSVRELPRNEKVVYLIGTEFPGMAERSWTNLLPPGYAYNNHPLSLWKGVLRETWDE